MPHSPKKRIKDLPLTDRPQEKLLLKGRQNLTDAELIAILLGTGSAKDNALVMADKLLKQLPLSTFTTLSLSDFNTLRGIGRTKAARILSAIEVGERIFSQRNMTTSVIRTTEAALEQLRDIASKKQEHLVVLYLNARYELLQKEILGLGNLNTALIEPKEIFAPAILNPCHGIILAHNHPSGDPEPSDADIAFTKRIHEAGEIMGIVLLDHLILCQNNYFSFRDGKKSEDSRRL